MKLHFLLRERNHYGLFTKVTLFLSTLSIWGCGGEKKQDLQQENYPVSVREVTLMKGTEQLDYSASVEADNTVDMAFSVSGRVLLVRVEEGAHVAKGALLAAVEPEKYQGAYDIANASFIKAADNFKRSKELYDKGSLPERDFIAAQADLAQAKANKDIAAKDLNDTRLMAPFAGVVTRKITELGALTAPGSPAFTLTKTDVMYVTAAIAEGDIARISEGDSVEVEIPALSERRMGRVNIVNPQADNYSRTFEVKVRLKNEDGKILPGMMAQLHIHTGKPESIIAIPTGSILKDVDNIAYVFLAQPDHTAIKKRITISRAIGQNDVVVSDGLQAGDQLIVEGQTKLTDGCAIQY